MAKRGDGGDQPQWRITLSHSQYVNARTTGEDRWIFDKLELGPPATQSSFDALCQHIATMLDVSCVSAKGWPWQHPIDGCGG